MGSVSNTAQMDLDFPKILEYTTSTGKRRVWMIDVRPHKGVSGGFAAVHSNSNTVAELIITHGDIGGALQTTTRVIHGKNIGRANQTTALEQACKDAMAKYTRKTLKTQQLNMAASIIPMLAHTYEKSGHRIIFPCYVQPKLDGVRGIYDPIRRQIYSRGESGVQHAFKNLDHIISNLIHVTIPIDGELYSPHLSFNELISALKSGNTPAFPIEFHMFDVITDHPFESRLVQLRALPQCSILHIVPTTICNHSNDVPIIMQNYINIGYEGIMLRNMIGLYIHARSYDLQKVKPFMDSEFRIVGYKRQNNSNSIIWICATEAGHTFTVAPNGTHQSRNLTDVDANAAIGQYLTVKYQELTTRGVPRFPVGLRIR